MPMNILYCGKPTILSPADKWVEHLERMRLWVEWAKTGEIEECWPGECQGYVHQALRELTRRRRNLPLAFSWFIPPSRSAPTEAWQAFLNRCRRFNTPPPPPKGNPPDDPDERAAWEVEQWWHERWESDLVIEIYIRRAEKVLRWRGDTPGAA